MYTHLNDDLRRKILELLTNGSSRRMAARYVGCAPSTITRAAERDPDFAEKLAAAENAAEIEALQAIRNAAKKDRYWRAAAWMLERRNPDDFARRSPKTFTQNHLDRIITILIEMIADEIPDKSQTRVTEKLNEMKDEINKQISLLGDGDIEICSSLFQPLLNQFPDWELDPCFTEDT